MSRSLADPLLFFLLRGTATVAAAVVLVIGAFVTWESIPALREIGLGPFLLDDSWHPTSGGHGALPMLLGTAAVTVGAIVLAAPLGIAIALFCHAGTSALLAGTVRRLLGLCAGTPSVVFGFWGLVQLVPLIGRLEPPGTSLLAGIVVVALMILPTVALLADASLRGAPVSLHRGAAALGLGRWATLWRVLLPSVRSGVWSGVLLATARAVGETMAVLMVCGNVVALPRSLFDPIRTLPANIALEMAYALDVHRSALFVTGLLLLAMVSALVLAAEPGRWRGRARV